MKYRQTLILVLISIFMSNETFGASSLTDKVPANGELFYINGSQGKLAAKISLPLLEASQKCPMVILSHGFGGDMTFHLWEPIIKILNEKGIGVLRYDFNGCGQSEGEFQNMTVLNEIEDLLCVISYVRSLSVTENISLVGHSQGGVVTSMVSGDCGESQIKCEVLLSAAAVLREDAIRGITQGAKFAPWHLDKPFYELPRGLKLGRDYIQTAMTLPIYDTASKYKGKALIINGMADQVVPFTYAQLYNKVISDSELILIPGEDHTYTITPEYAVKLVTDWLVGVLAD